MFWKRTFDFDKFQKRFDEGPRDPLNQRDPFWSLSDQYPREKKLYKERLRGMIASAISKENDRDLNKALVLASWDGLDLDYADLLKTALRLEWHYRHEDIVLYMDQLRDETFTEDLFSAANNHKEYEGDEELQPFLRKCVRALWAIGTPRAKELVQRLVETGNPNVQIVVTVFKDYNQ
ncbi:MAG: hypothetical protein MUE88_02920 [Flavobacteriales bacterium]|jgi:hypothetical protein|nr:hypothetical protein [Flavobacteriales bacterium]